MITSPEIGPRRGRSTHHGVLEEGRRRCRESVGEGALDIFYSGIYSFLFDLHMHTVLKSEGEPGTYEYFPKCRPSC